MSTEFTNLEEIYTKVIIKGYLKNITDNKTDNFEVKGIKNKNKISYITDNIKYNIKIINKNKLLFQRENNDFKHSFIFDNNKTTISNYLILENELDLEIEVKVLSLIINDNLIKINYLVPDSNIEFEYKLEMSDK